MSPSPRPCVEYEIYLPLTDAGGVPYTARVLSGARKKLTAFFGGLTDTRHRNKGIWKVGGVTVRDQIVIWRVVSTRGRAGDAYLRKLKAELEAALRQDEILVVRRVVGLL